MTLKQFQLNMKENEWHIKASASKTLPGGSFQNTCYRNRTIRCLNFSIQEIFKESLSGKKNDCVEGQLKIQSQCIPNMFDKRMNNRRNILSPAFLGKGVVKGK